MSENMRAVARYVIDALGQWPDATQAEVICGVGLALSSLIASCPDWDASEKLEFADGCSGRLRRSVAYMLQTSQVEGHA